MKFFGASAARLWLNKFGSGIVALGLLSGCTGGEYATTQSSEGTPAETAVTVSPGACGHGWQSGRTGLHTFLLHNISAGAADVYLINPLVGSLDSDSVSAPVFAEVERLGPGTTAPMQVDIGSGAYAFECDIQHYGTSIGPIVRIPDDVRGTPGILSVTFNDLMGPPANHLSPVRQYRAYVSSGLVSLVQQTDTLAKDIRAGNLNSARQAWLAAHLAYERLGAAYGTFGSFDSEIDGRADGLPGGVNSPRFTGFYRIEYGLWHGQSAAELTGPVGRLDQDVRALHRAFPRLQFVLGDLGLRTHEILENAVQFQLTGHDDYGSGTTLATTAANIEGTRELLTVLHPLLVTRYSDLPAVTLWLDRLQRLVNAARSSDGRWTPVSELGASQREKIDAAAGQALEDLAPIATIFEVSK